MQDADPNFEDLPNPGFPWLRFVALFGVLAALAFSIWYFPNKYGADLSGRMLALSQRYLVEGRENDAILCLRSAVRLDPGNLIAWHKLATLVADQQNYASALDVYMTMFEEAAKRGLTSQLPRIFSSLQDQRLLMLVALRRDDKQLLKSAADGVGQLAGNKALARLMLADCFSANGERNRAVKELVTAPAHESIFTAPWKLSDLLQGKKTASVDVGFYFDILSETAARLGDVGYEVFFFGLNNCLVPLDRIPALASSLAANPVAPIRMRIFAAKLAASIAGKPLDVDALCPADPKLLSVQDRILLGREFLIGGSPEKVLEMIDFVSALQSNEAFKLRTQAFFATDRKAEAFEALDHPSNPLSEKETAFELFKLLSMSGQDAAARKLLESLAIDPENEEADRLLFAGFFAKTGQEERLAALIRSIPEKWPERETLPESILLQARERGDLQAAITMQSARLLVFKPAKPAALFADREILVQLAGRPPDLPGLEALLRDKPDSAPLRISLALALLSSGRRQDALELLRERSAQIDIRSLKTHQKVALALVLAANNFTGPATEIARLVSVETPFPAESQKLSSALSTAAAETAPVQK